MVSVNIEFKNSGFVDAVASSKLIKNKEEREFVREFLLDGFEVWENLLQGKEEFSTGVTYSFCDSLFYDGVIQPGKNDLLALAYFLDTVAVLASDPDDFDAFIIQFGFLLREWFDANDGDVVLTNKFVFHARSFRPLRSGQILKAWIKCVQESEPKNFDFLQLPIEWQIELAIKDSELTSMDSIRLKARSLSRENILIKENSKDFVPINIDFLYPYVIDKEIRDSLKNSHKLREKVLLDETREVKNNHQLEP